MTFIPFNGQVEIKPLEEGGIVASQNEKFDCKGEILSFDGPIQGIKIGDIAYFNSWDANKCHTDGEEYKWLVHHTDILAIETKAPEA